MLENPTLRGPLWESISAIHVGNIPVWVGELSGVRMAGRGRGRAEEGGRGNGEGAEIGGGERRGRGQAEGGMGWWMPPVGNVDCRGFVPSEIG